MLHLAVEHAIQLLHAVSQALKQCQGITGDAETVKLQEARQRLSMTLLLLGIRLNGCAAK